VQNEQHHSSPLLSSQPTAAAAKGREASLEVAVCSRPSHKPSSYSSSLLSRIRHSRFAALFMAERVVKEALVLPSPIHRLYRFLEETQRAAHHGSPHTLTAAVSLSRTSPNPTQVTTLPAEEVVMEQEAVVPPQGDVYSFTFSRREVAQLRDQQRRYFYQQRSSPYAPQLVNLDRVAETLLHECEMEGTVEVTSAQEMGYICKELDPATTTSERVAELLSVFCTRGIPQDEFLDAVFDFRMGVLQRTCKAVPLGVVVPSLMHPDVSLSEAVATRRCRKGSGGTSSTRKGTVVMSQLTVTYPHPGVPYTFEDLARDPVQLSAAQRLERRTALLHRRSLSEDVYGTLSAYRCA
jgi:hypothetical protein